MIIGSFDRFFAFAGEACLTLWSGRPQVKHNDVQRTRKTGLWRAKSVHLVRCGACPMHRIALRATPARVNGFDSIKWVHNYFLWYNVNTVVIADPCQASSSMAFGTGISAGASVHKRAHSMLRPGYTRSSALAYAASWRR